MSYIKNTNMTIKFKRKNIISATNVSIWKIIWNYICWILAGRPENWEVNE